MTPEERKEAFKKLLDLKNGPISDEEKLRVFKQSFQNDLLRMTQKASEDYFLGRIDLNEFSEILIILGNGAKEQQKRYEDYDARK